MGLTYKGRDEDGNRIWKDRQGREYVAAQLAKKNENGSNSSSTTPAGTYPDWQQYAKGNPYSAPVNYGADTAGYYVPPTVNFPRNEVTNQAQSLNSWSQVANPCPVISPLNTINAQTQDEIPLIQTHFIEEATGKYLGKSAEYYKLKLPDELVTFPTIKVNIKTIPEDDWMAIPKVFDNISEPLKFDKQQVASDFKKIIEKNKNAQPFDRRFDMNAIDKNVEQGLVIVHDLLSKTITSYVLPDYINTVDSVEVFNLLIQRSSDKNDNTDGNYLVHPKDWAAAIKENNPRSKKFYIPAREAKLIVIGISHTHPEVINSNNISTTVSAGHSLKDYNLSQIQYLPYIIIKVSVRANRNGNTVTLTLELMYKGSTGINDVKSLPNFDTFINTIEKCIFEYVIKMYHK